MATTDALRSIDVRRWHRCGYFARPGWFRWRWTSDGEEVASIVVHTYTQGVRLNFRSRADDEDEWTERERAITLVHTPCHFGGERVWFSCPTWNCGRRAAILYLSPGGRVACRRCFRLAYECQREKPHYRAMRRAVKIRKRLGDPDGYTLDEITRPKGMHSRTYQRLLDAHYAAEYAADRLAYLHFSRRFLRRAR